MNFTSIVIVLIWCGWAYSRREYEIKKKDIQGDCGGKAETKKKMKKQWPLKIKKKELLNFCRKGGYPVENRIFMAPVGPAVLIHQHEEACERLSGPLILMHGFWWQKRALIFLRVKGLSVEGGQEGGGVEKRNNKRKKIREGYRT